MGAEYKRGNVLLMPSAWLKWKKVGRESMVDAAPELSKNAAAYSLPGWY